MHSQWDSVSIVLLVRVGASGGVLHIHVRYIRMTFAICRANQCILHSSGESQGVQYTVMKIPHTKEKVFHEGVKV